VHDFVSLESFDIYKYGCGTDITVNFNHSCVFGIVIVVVNL
jgi:hypothetical protein